MSANVEVKAWLHDPSAAVKKLRELASSEPEVLSQDDRFYGVPRGRLKMRCDPKGTCELVYYRRENAHGPRVSSYFREALEDPIAKDAELARAYGPAGRVRKERLVFYVRDVRVHIDVVEELGSFLEIEVPIHSTTEYPHARAVAVHLMRVLNIPDDTLIEESYEELLAKRRLRLVDMDSTK